MPVSQDCGAVAQLGERLVRNEEVSGSIPLSSTKKINDLPAESSRFNVHAVVGVVTLWQGRSISNLLRIAAYNACAAFHSLSLSMAR